MKFLSHTNPNMALVDHLTEVASLSECMIKETPIVMPEKGFLSQLSMLIGIAHDFGKYTSYFQDYLQSGNSFGKNHHHSFISAFFGAYIIGQFSLDLTGWREYAPLLAYFIILHHHGDLRAIEDDIIDFFEYEDGKITPGHFADRVDVLKIQIENMDQLSIEIEKEYNTIFNNVGINKTKMFVSGFLNEWESCLERLDELQYQWRLEKDRVVRQKVYYYTLLLYSCLIDSDKHSAARVRRPRRRTIPADLVDRYRARYFNVNISEGTNGWRNRIYDTVMKRLIGASELIDHQHLYTLTSPTGSGKTLLSFSVALKWRKQLQEKMGYTPRIIYALPFTSIIDQNEKVLRSVLSQMDDFTENEHNYLIKHHHLSAINYRHENEETSIRDSLLLIESWEAEVIVTTFIQLFYTVIGFKNRFLKKFHHLAGSIIILDEVQNLKMEYWPLIRWTLKSLTETLGCKILLLTATQPLIFEEHQPIELLQGSKGFFQEMNRVQLSIRDHDGSYFEVDGWVGQFIEDFKEGYNYLAVFNTIKTSIEIYKKIRDWINSKGLDYEVVYLSTNIIPRERKMRIRRIKKWMKEDKNVILISTQVVEAGVDLDFHIVYRDLGPVDSIVQVAGRCNRNGKRKIGDVIVTPLVRGHHLEAKNIYGSLHTSMALEVLPKQPLEEKDFYDVINVYFESVLKRKNLDQSEEIWKAMNELFFHDEHKTKNKKAVSDFKLIDDQSNYLDVFIEVDSYAKVIWSEYKEKVLQEEDYKKRYEANLSLKNLLRQYIVSTPIHLVKGFYQGNSITLLPYENVPQYYNEEFGVIRSQEDVDAWVM